MAKHRPVIRSGRHAWLVGPGVRRRGTGPLAPRRRLARGGGAGGGRGKSPFLWSRLKRKETPSAREISRNFDSGTFLLVPTAWTPLPSPTGPKCRALTVARQSCCVFPGVVRNQTFFRSARSSSSINFFTSAGFIFGKSPRKCSSTPDATTIRFQTSASPGADADAASASGVPGHNLDAAKQQVPQFIRSPPGQVPRAALPGRLPPPLTFVSRGWQVLRQTDNEIGNGFRFAISAIPTWGMNPSPRCPGMSQKRPETALWRSDSPFPQKSGQTGADC